MYQHYDTGLPNKACPRLCDLATAPARGITQESALYIVCYTLQNKIGDLSNRIQLAEEQPLLMSVLRLGTR